MLYFVTHFILISLTGVKFIIEFLTVNIIQDVQNIYKDACNDYITNKSVDCFCSSTKAL